jgi:prophage antirepressor-like protein
MGDLLMNNIQIFNNPEFGDIRTVVIDNEPWFVGKDVADILPDGKTEILFSSDDNGIYICKTEKKT